MENEQIEIKATVGIHDIVEAVYNTENFGLLDFVGEYIEKAYEESPSADQLVCSVAHNALTNLGTDSGDLAVVNKAMQQLASLVKSLVHNDVDMKIFLNKLNTP